MRVAFFVDQFPSLSETFILNQITGLIDRGHQVDIYAERPGDTTKVHSDVEKYDLLSQTIYIGESSAGLSRYLKAFGLFISKVWTSPIQIIKSLNIFRYKRKALSLGLFFSTLKVINGVGNYDVIHCHFGPNGISAAMLREIGAIQGKLVTTFHGYDISSYPKKFGSKVYDFLFSKGDLFLVISEYMKSQLEQLGCMTEKIAIHRVGVDSKKFLFVSRSKSEKDVVQITSISRLVEKKGIEYGLYALSSLKNAGIRFNYQIIGDGPLKEGLQQLVNELNLIDCVTFLGWKEQQEVIDLLYKSHILLAPSVTSKEGDQEGIPTVLIESLMMGLPIASTYHSGIPEVVQDRISGVLSPERDTAALVQGLLFLCKHPEKWPEMGRLGREFVEKNFDINKLNNELIEIYQGLIFKDLKE